MSNKEAFYHEIIREPISDFVGSFLSIAGITTASYMGNMLFATVFPAALPFTSINLINVIIKNAATGIIYNTGYTISSFGYCKFVGYANEECSAKLSDITDLQNNLRIFGAITGNSLGPKIFNKFTKTSNLLTRIIGKSFGKAIFGSAGDTIGMLLKDPKNNYDSTKITQNFYNNSKPFKAFLGNVMAYIGNCRADAIFGYQPQYVLFSGNYYLTNEASTSIFKQVTNVLYSRAYNWLLPEETLTTKFDKIASEYNKEENKSHINRKRTI